MGQAQSGDPARPPLTSEQLSHELALKFAKRCFTPLELYSFRDVFRSLADTSSDVQYWREDTLRRFLELPDALAVAPVIYQSVTYLGAFPFPSLAPSILSFEALLKVVVIMTERYGRVLKKGNTDRTRLLFRSLAVFDRQIDTHDEDKDKERLRSESSASKNQDTQEFQDALTEAARGVSVDDAANDGSEDEDDDELALAALESLDAIEVFKHGERSSVNHAQIPTDNFRHLLMLLIVTAPLGPQESLSKHSHRFQTEEQLAGLKRIADNILWAFNIENHPGVLYSNFTSIIPTSLPHLFDGFNPLFEHFLFSKSLDFSLHKPSAAKTINPASSPSPLRQEEPPLPPILPEPGEILDLNLLSQISFFLSGPSLFRRLRPLYSGATAGFSLGSFETHIFNWRAPTLLLVSGSRIANPPSSPGERAFAETLPSKRYPDGPQGNINTKDHTADEEDEEPLLIFGAYVPTPWKTTPKNPLSSPDSLLFQLSPVHSVLRPSPSSSSTDHITFLKPPLPHAGIAIGCPLPSHQSPHRPLGLISLSLDASLEFGVFTHLASDNFSGGGGGGAYAPSPSPHLAHKDWQERFAVRDLEVWGVGGEEEEKVQRERWAWEEKEAERRRRVNLRSGDLEADRALLEMAGLIGQHRSGGSMG